MPAPLTGQGVGVGLGTPVPLSLATVQCTVFTVRAPTTNSAAVFLGNSTVSSTTGHQFDPGYEVTYERNTQNTDGRRELTVSDLFVAGGSGDKLTWFASP